MLCAVAPSGPPWNVSLHGWTSDAACVEWAPPGVDEQNGEISGYYVEMSALGNRNNSQLVLLGTGAGAGAGGGGWGLGGQLASRATIPASQALPIPRALYQHFVHSLVPGTFYLVTVQAFNAKGAGPKSAPFYFRTKQNGTRVAHISSGYTHIPIGLLATIPTACSSKFISFLIPIIRKFHFF